MFRLRNVLKYCLTTQQLNPKECYYKSLGIQTTVDMDKIRQSYLQMVKKYHPDLNQQTNTTQIFTKIKKAYEVLSQQQSKKQYDIARGYNRFTKENTIQLDKADQIIQKMRQKYLKGQQNRRKDLLNDEFNFSYKLYEKHFDKIQSKKGDYIKYKDEDGNYYEHKQYVPPPFYKSYMFAIVPIGCLGGYFIYKSL